MRRGWLLLICALLSVFVVFGQGAGERAYMKRAEFEQWQNRELKSERFQQLPYRIAHFKGSGNAPALVVWIHGGHSCGEDNQSHIGDHYGAISKLAAQLRNRQIDAVLAAPHCSEQMREDGFGTTKLLCDWLKSIITTEGIDADRVYLIGASFGGMMVSKVASACPNIPAAVEIIGTVPHIRTSGTPQFAVCCVASDADNPRKFEHTTEQMLSLQELGCKTLFVEHSGLSHRDICERGIEPKILDWLLSHKRQR